MSEIVTGKTKAVTIHGDMDGQLICSVILKQVQWPQLIQLTGGNQIYAFLLFFHSLDVCECEKQ